MAEQEGEAKQVKEQASKLLREIQQLSEEATKLSREREKANVRLLELKKKLKEFKLFFAKERMKKDEECDLLNGDWKVRIYEIICYKDGYNGEYIDDYERPKKYYEIDMSGDPEFNCDHCETEHNHTGLGKVGETCFQDDFHKVKVVAEITIDELVKLLGA